MEMTSTIDLSIIIPTLNEEVHLPKLLEDLKNQSKTNFEVTVVDGGSKDATVSMVKTLSTRDSRIRLLSSHKQGVSAQRNLGAKKARTAWLLFLDADTRLPPIFLKQLVARVKKTPCDICTTYAVPDTDKLTDKLLLNAHNTIMQGVAFLKKPYAFGACLLCSKEAFHKVGGFDEVLDFQEDSDFIQRVTKSGGKFIIFPTPEYVFCMRRYAKDGTLSVILKTLPLSLKSFVTDSFQSDIESYPMSGGKAYKRKKI